MEPIAIAGFAITAIASIWKVFGVVDNLDNRLSDLDHKIDKIELTTNGIRERMEHINTRLSAQYKELGNTQDSIEGFLVKHTAYERRSRD